MAQDFEIGGGRRGSGGGMFDAAASAPPPQSARSFDAAIAAAAAAEIATTGAGAAGAAAAAAALRTLPPVGHTHGAVSSVQELRDMAARRREAARVEARAALVRVHRCCRHGSYELNV